jgi:hypothetical protein
MLRCFEMRMDASFSAYTETEMQHFALIGYKTEQEANAQDYCSFLLQMLFGFSGPYSFRLFDLDDVPDTAKRYVCTLPCNDDSKVTRKKSVANSEIPAKYRPFTRDIVPFSR